jgi:phage baseplate assembly protein W
MKRFLGFPYPIEKTSQGYFYSQSEIDQIKSDMLILLLTNPGERVMTPEYGTPLKKLIFEPNDQTLRNQARNMIIQSLNRWEPRVSIQQVEVLTKVDENSLNSLDDKTEKDGILFIRINFIDPKNIREVQELVLELPLAGQTL